MIEKKSRNYNHGGGSHQEGNILNESSPIDLFIMGIFEMMPQSLKN